MRRPAFVSAISDALRPHLPAFLTAMAWAFCSHNMVLAQSQGDQSLKKLLAELQSQEALYADIEVEWSTKYACHLIRDEAIPAEEIIRSIESESRSVAQAGMLYVNANDRLIPAQGKAVDRSLIHGFDGETTRIVKNEGVANILNEKKNCSRRFIPNAHFLKNDAWGRTLTEFLSTSVDGKIFHEASYEGEETVDNLRCAKVYCYAWTNQHLEHGKRSLYIFWLARDRNLLPIKCQCFLGRYSNTIPRSITIVADMREIEPGLWFPFKVKHDQFEESALMEGKQELLSTKERVITKVDLHPNYPQSFFSDIAIPKEAYLYHVRQGTIVSGSSPSQRAAEKSASGRGLRLVLIVALLIGAGLIVFVWKRKRNA